MKSEDNLRSWADNSSLEKCFGSRETGNSKRLELLSKGVDSCLV